VFKAETEMEYRNFSVYIILLFSVLSGIYLSRKILITKGKVLSQATNKMCAKYFSRLVEKSK